jgi:hypothetical protein
VTTASVRIQHEGLISDAMNKYTKHNHYADCHYAECRVLFVVIQIATLMSAIMLAVMVPGTCQGKLKA